MMPLRKLAVGTGTLFTDGDWIESPFIREEGIRLIQTGNIGIGHYKEQGLRFIDEATFAGLRCTEVSPHDILICRLADPVGRACLAPTLESRMITSVDVCIFRPRSDIDRRFLVYYFSSVPWLDSVHSIARGGTRERISRDQLGAIPVPVPPQETQEAIADFLDREAARIDRAVRRHQDLIDLTHARFWSQVSLATHSSAVFAGTTPPTTSAPPTWFQMPLKRCFARMDYGIGERTLESGRFPVLGMKHVGRGELLGAAEGFVDFVSEELLLEAGDLLFNRTNSLPLVGKVGMFRGQSRPTTFASYLVRLRCIPDFDPRFLNYLLNTDDVLGLARSLALPSIGQANLNPNRYSQIRISIPAGEEQRNIAARLDHASAEVQRARSSLSRQIRLLQERRQALITEVVTGQIDVLGDAA